MLTGPITSNIYTKAQDAATGNPMWRYFQARAIVPNSVFVIMSFQGEGTGEVLGLIREECRNLD
jgi:hypothetical protein